MIDHEAVDCVPQRKPRVPRELWVVTRKKTDLKYSHRQWVFFFSAASVSLIDRCGSSAPLLLRSQDAPWRLVLGEDSEADPGLPGSSKMNWWEKTTGPPRTDSLVPPGGLRKKTKKDEIVLYNKQIQWREGVSVRWRQQVSLSLSDVAALIWSRRGGHAVPGEETAIHLGRLHLGGWVIILKRKLWCHRRWEKPDRLLMYLHHHAALTGTLPFSPSSSSDRSQGRIPTSSSAQGKNLSVLLVCECVCVCELVPMTTL